MDKQYANKIPDDVKAVMRKLNENGYEAYIVGGAVRDMILRVTPHDFDITTNALPKQTKALFEKTIDTGIKHGTVTAMINHEGYEITTYRIDGDYSDGRHPDSVEFTDDITCDLARRDLTINAMAMDIDGNIVDPFNGMKDIEKKVIRCVGNPADRFNEDALRMLRAIRFGTKLEYKLEDDTLMTIKDNYELIRRVSAERIREEMTKLLMTNHPSSGINRMVFTGLMKEIIPPIYDIYASKDPDVIYYSCMSNDLLNKTPVNQNMRWAALLESLRYSGVKDLDRSVDFILREKLKFSNRDLMEIKAYVMESDLSKIAEINTPSEIRRFASKYGEEFCEKLIEFQKIKMDDFITLPHEHPEEKYVVDITDFHRQLQNCLRDGTAITKHDLKISGNDLIKMGLEGKEIGEFLNYAYEECLKTPENNNKDTLTYMASDYINKEKENEDYEF